MEKHQQIHFSIWYFLAVFFIILAIQSVIFAHHILTPHSLRS